MPHDPRHPREYSPDELETAMLLTERQVAEQLHVKPCTVRNERLRGTISYVRVGCRFYYTQEYIDDYIREHTTHAVSQPSERSARPLASIASPRITRVQPKDSAVDEMRKQLARERVAEIFTKPPPKSR
jgi:hypothetical protein